MIIPADCAEKELIAGILDIPFFMPSSVTRRLATYVYSTTEEKQVLICELMDYLWSSILKIGIFPVFKEFDGFMAASGKRTHFIHQFEVFLLGLYIIKLLRERHVSFAPDLSLDVIYNIWLMTATAHDLGRPLEVSSVITDRLSSLYGKLGMHSLERKFSSFPKKKLLLDEQELLRIEIGCTDRYTSSVCNVSNVMCEAIASALGIAPSEALDIENTLREEDNHGWVSAAILFKSAIESMGSTRGSSIETWDMLPSLRKAMGAIAVHNLHKSEKKEYVSKIGLSENPFAFLLFFTDSIQDWSRSSSDESWPVYSLKSLSVIDDKLCLKYILDHDRWTAGMHKKALEGLEEKCVFLNKLKGPEPGIHLTVQIDYESSDGVVRHSIPFLF
jgi:hypothetical protein